MNNSTNVLNKHHARRIYVFADIFFIRVHVRNASHEFVFCALKKLQQMSPQHEAQTTKTIELSKLLEFIF